MRSRDYASPDPLPGPAQASLPAGRARPFAGRVSHPLDGLPNFMSSSHLTPFGPALPGRTAPPIRRRIAELLPAARLHAVGDGFLDSTRCPHVRIEGRRPSRPSADPDECLADQDGARPSRSFSCPVASPWRTRSRGSGDCVLRCRPDVISYEASSTAVSTRKKTAGQILMVGGATAVLGGVLLTVFNRNSTLEQSPQATPPRNDAWLRDPTWRQERVVPNVLTASRPPSATPAGPARSLPLAVTSVLARIIMGRRLA